MKRTMELSIALLFGCGFVGSVWKIEAAEARSHVHAASMVQISDDNDCESDTDYWALFAAASAAQ